VQYPRLAAITRFELPLLNAAIDVHVGALLDSQGDVRKASVKAQAMPVRVLFYFSVAIPVPGTLSHPRVSDSSARRQIPAFRLFGEEAGNYNPVHLHHG
jgi:hypothetical protein